MVEDPFWLILLQSWRSSTIPIFNVSFSWVYPRGISLCMISIHSDSRHTLLVGNFFFGELSAIFSMNFCFNCSVGSGVLRETEKKTTALIPSLAIKGRRFLRCKSYLGDYLKHSWRCLLTKAAAWSSVYLGRRSFRCLPRNATMSRQKSLQQLFKERLDDCHHAALYKRQVLINLKKKKYQSAYGLVIEPLIDFERIHWSIRHVPTSIKKSVPTSRF